MATINPQTSISLRPAEAPITEKSISRDMKARHSEDAEAGLCRTDGFCPIGKCGALKHGGQTLTLSAGNDDYGT